MQKKRPPIIAIIVLILILAAAGYFGIRALTRPADTSLKASGSIETVQVTVSAEMPGKVAQVLADEGDPVKAGQVLFRLDDTLLQAQRKVAAASLELAQAAANTAKRAQDVAQANFDLVYNAALVDAAASRTADWHAANPPGYTLPGGYFTINEQMIAARDAMEAAATERDTAQDKVNDLYVSSAGKPFFAAEKDLLTARASVLVAQDVLNRANLSSNADLRDEAQSAYDAARTGLDNAQLAYDDLKDTQLAKDILAARLGLSVAQEAYDAANNRLLASEIGIYSPRVTAAQAALNQAVEAAQQAGLAVSQAQASLDLLDLQVAKLTVQAPSNGVVLTRSIETGEVVSAGAAAFSIGQLDTLTITVYIPEDRYGEVKLGQAAAVTVDPFPGETFTAVVVHIADQAEFTPRNVQTVSGRKATVFAIKLQLQDPQGKLKPGMPADVQFH